MSFQRNISVQNVVWKEGRYYVAQCLNVDVSSFGKTKKEALINTKKAIKVYMEAIEKSEMNKSFSKEIIYIPVSFAAV